MQVERIDDVPLICSELKILELSRLITEHFPVHGNWQGSSIGDLSCVFLTYILSESDHRLSHVEDWFMSLQHVLRYSLGSPNLVRLDCTDDRLESLLDYMSDDSCYRVFEKALNQQIISVYQLEDELSVIHLDATIAQSYRDPNGSFAMGYAKQRHASLPQIKVMLGTLSPLGMPLCVEVVNGSSSDDVLYLPMVDRVATTLEKKGLLFVGDSKLGSMGNRCVIAQKGHYYLTPLNRVQLPFDTLQKMVSPEALAAASEKLIYLGENKAIKAFEQSKNREYEGYEWQERLIIAFSPTYAKTQIAQLDKQINQTKQAIQALTEIKQGKTPIQNEQELQQKIKELLHKSKTTAFFDIKIQTTTHETIVRKYGNRPEQMRLKYTFEVTIDINLATIKAHKETLGWRVYATNAPFAALNTAKVIETYKEEYKVEYCFDQLHNKIAALMPIFLHKENRITALIRLLMIAIKVHSIIQFKAREALRKTQTQVNELFPGNPGRKTDLPTTELILRAFMNISLVFIVLSEGNIHIEVTKLSNSQKQLLLLLNIDPRIYEDLPLFLKSNFKINET